jgi:hypothetical protein
MSDGGDWITGKAGDQGERERAGSGNSFHVNKKNKKGKILLLL